jgi:hypothetical protein
MSEMILAIGGPKNFEWVPDTGPRMRALDTSKLKPVDFLLEEIHSLTAVYDPPITEYRIEKLGDPKTNTIKRIYVSSGLTSRDAMEMLKDHLLGLFISTESPDDSVS